MAQEFNRKLFNKGQRRIDMNPGSRPNITVLEFHPQRAEAFTDDEASLLLNLYPNEIIDMNNVTVESLMQQQNGPQKIDMQAELDKQEADIATRLADAKALRAQKAYEEALAAGMTENEARQIAGLPVVGEAPKEVENPNAPAAEDAKAKEKAEKEAAKAKEKAEGKTK